eukprot:GHVR01084185.1.p1 GENE.GHVR01084185.1~~GHVR01084185.1.p1  ORF type:complete len:100 (-),score=2.28 GHVR01084185.1:208-507(-)
MQIFLHYGLLYRKSKYGYQSIIPPSLRMELFRQMHGLAHVGGHLGRDRTYHKVRERVWWPGYMGQGLARAASWQNQDQNQISHWPAASWICRATFLEQY